MEAGRHQHRGEVQAVHSGEESGHRDTGAKYGQREHGQCLLADYQENKDYGEREKSRDFAEALQNANFDAGESGAFDDEVVQQRRPGIECDRHGDRHEDQQCYRGLPSVCLHGIRSLASRVSYSLLRR